jgi:hypothetical protein
VHPLPNWARLTATATATADTDGLKTGRNRAEGGDGDLGAVVAQAA